MARVIESKPPFSGMIDVTEEDGLGLKFTALKDGDVLIEVEDIDPYMGGTVRLSREVWDRVVETMAQ